MVLRGRWSARILGEDVRGSDELAGDVVYLVVMEAPELRRYRCYGMSKVGGRVMRGGVLGCIRTVHFFESIIAVGGCSPVSAVPRGSDRLLNDRLEHGFICQVMSLRPCETLSSKRVSDYNERHYLL